MRSDQIKKGLERVPHRALLHATGLSRKDFEKPFIGVVTSSGGSVTRAEYLFSSACRVSAMVSRWGIWVCAILWR
jgi:dihydroxyacid dehydratase/phosphogluconate dehydratase